MVIYLYGFASYIQWFRVPINERYVQLCQNEKPRKMNFKHVFDMSGINFYLLKKLHFKTAS